MSTRITHLEKVSYNPIIFGREDRDERDTDVLADSFSSLSSIHQLDASPSPHTPILHTRAQAPSVSSFGGRSSSLSSSSTSSFFVEDVIPETQKKTKAILKQWQEHIQTRFQMYKNSRQEATDTPESLAEFKDKVKVDQAYKDDYVELVSRTRASIDTPIDDPLKSRHIRVLYSRNFFSPQADLDDVKAIAHISIDKAKSELYVSTLLVAPWNLPMNAPSILPKHTPEKGAGTLMLHSLCVTAQKLHLSFLKLKPLSGSVSAYKTLGMDYDEANDIFTYMIDGTGLPEQLTTRITSHTWHF